MTTFSLIMGILQAQKKVKKAVDAIQATQQEIELNRGLMEQAQLNLVYSS